MIERGFRRRFKEGAEILSVIDVFFDLLEDEVNSVRREVGSENKDGYLVSVGILVTVLMIYGVFIEVGQIAGSEVGFQDVNLTLIVINAHRKRAFEEIKEHFSNKRRRKILVISLVLDC